MTELATMLHVMLDTNLTRKGHMIKKIITTAVISTALLMGANNMAQSKEINLECDLNKKKPLKININTELKTSSVNWGKTLGIENMQTGSVLTEAEHYKLIDLRDPTLDSAYQPFGSSFTINRTDLSIEMNATGSSLISWKKKKGTCKIIETNNKI